jgi:hypothetical protein
MAPEALATTDAEAIVAATFGLAPVGGESLVTELSARVLHYIRHDRHGLMAICYRIDIDETALVAALQAPTQEAAAEAVARLAIARQLDKLKRRMAAEAAVKKALGF